MKHQLLAAVLLVSAACTHASPALRGLDVQTASISSADLGLIIGKGWAGSLTYLDYSSEQKVEIPVELDVSMLGPTSVAYAVRYPGETQHNSTEILQFSDDGRTLNGEPVIDRVDLANDATAIVTSFSGRDNNETAEIRMTYSFSRSVFEIKKEVQVGPDAPWFERSKYHFTR